MLLLLHFLFLINTCSSAASYVKSIFGHPGKDEVENEFVDGFEILQRNLPRPARQHIKNGHFTSTIIDDNNYPWPGHDLQGDNTWTLLQQESEAIKKFYDNKVDLTNDQIYWHPAASRNIYSTDEILDNAERVKIKIVLDPKYRLHYLPAIFPPGEIVTIEISEHSVNKVTINTNTQTRDIRDSNGKPQYKQRLPLLTITTKLTQTVNKVGNPYGGSVSFGMSGTDPIEMIVTNVILMPKFTYGYTSDKDWDYQVKNYKGSFAFIDTGNLVHIMPSNRVASTTRMNDIQHYWRSAIQISQTTAQDYLLNNNPRYGRFTSPCHMKYDVFVPAGAAVAFGSGNFVHCPLDWTGTVTKWDSTIVLPWGTLHEINHNRQENYGKSQPSNGEMTNNIINLQVIAKTNTASESRSTDVWGSYTYSSHFLNSVNNNDGLPRYSTLIHFFGVDKFKEYIKACQENALFTDQEYGEPGADLLRASKVFNRDLHYHWNFHGSTDEVLNKGEGDTFQALRAMNLKPFHPVTNIYVVGAIVDGKEFITARPCQIKPWEQVIDFASGKVQRENKEQFGDFEFSSAIFEKGREGAWKEQSKGAYLMTPKEEPNAIEEVRVNYLDKTTNEIHTVICQFSTLSSNKFATFSILGNIPDSENDIFKAYRYIAHNGAKENIIETNHPNKDLFREAYTNDNIHKFISVIEGMLSPAQTADYIISITSKNSGLFYISEEPLKGDPDLDSEYLTNYLPGTQMDFNKGNHSKTLHLETEKFYHFRFVLYPAGTKVQGYAGFKKAGSSDSFQTIPTSWYRYRKITDKYLWDSQFKPDFERIYLMDEWNQLIKNDQSKWKLNKNPKGGTICNSRSGQGEGCNGLPLIDSITDGDDSTEFRADWWNGQPAPLPHIYEFDMGDNQKFDTIKLKGAGNFEWFGMRAYTKIYLGTDNSEVTSSDTPCTEESCSVNHESSLIWEGMYDTQYREFIEFKKELSGRFLKVVFVNNSKGWKDGNPQRTDISALEVGYMPNNRKIYPITNTKYIRKTNRWDKTHSGSYYNGIGLTGYAANVAPKIENDDENNQNSIMKIRIPKSKPEIGIIGDYYPSMGTAVVKIDGNEVGRIHDSYDKEGDKRKLKFASRAHMSLLFYYKELNPETEHLLTIEVIEGQITLAGLLTHQMVVKYNTDDYRYPKILETEFDHQPEQFDWYKTTSEIGPYVPPIKTPEPFTTPEPLEIQEILVDDDDGIIETNGLDPNKEYSAKVTTDDVEIHGNGHENLYISIIEKVNVKPTEAQFGIDLDFESTVVLNQENAKMNLKGSGTLNIKSSNNANAITINDVTVSQYKKIVIQPDPKLSSLEFNNLSMYGESIFDSGLINGKELVKANSITVFNGATANISNIQPHNKVTVELNAVMSINNVDLSKLKQMEIQYQSLNNPRAPITGKLNDPPNEIILEQQESSKSLNTLDEKVFVIASAENEDFQKCKKWISKVKISGTQFKSVECRNVDNQRELVASSKSKKNKAGVIAGVVIAVVLVIAAVAVAVFIILKKKRATAVSDNQNSSMLNSNFDI